MSNSKILLLICIATSSVCGMNNIKFQSFVLPKDISQSVQNAKKNPNLIQGYFLNNNQENQQNQYNINNINQLNSNSREREQPSLTPTRDVNSNDIVSPNPTPGNSRRSSLKKSSSTELIEKNSEMNPWIILMSVLCLQSNNIKILNNKIESLEAKLEAKNSYALMQRIKNNHENKSIKKNNFVQDLSMMEKILKEEKDSYHKTLLQTLDQHEGTVRQIKKEITESISTQFETYFTQEKKNLETIDQKNQEIEQKNIEIAGYKRQLEEQTKTLEQGPPWYKQPRAIFVFGGLAGGLTCHFISNPQLYLWAFVKTTSMILRGIANLASKKEAASA